MPKPLQPNFILDVEMSELFIQAGLQDRVIQVSRDMYIQCVYVQDRVIQVSYIQCVYVQDRVIQVSYIQCVYVQDRVIQVSRDMYIQCVYVQDRVIQVSRDMYIQCVYVQDRVIQVSRDMYRVIQSLCVAVCMVAFGILTCLECECPKRA